MTRGGKEKSETKVAQRRRQGGDIKWNGKI